jgi:hypothetical protein
MVVGKAEPTDLKMNIGAKKLNIGGNIYKPNEENSYNVYSDLNNKDRRDVFVPSNARSDFREDLPRRAKVYYSGKWRNAKLSFRYASGGRGPLPVYTFDVK